MPFIASWVRLTMRWSPCIRRRRLQFTIRGVLALMFVCCLVAAWPHLYQWWTAERLSKFAGIDLRHTDEVSREHAIALFKRLVPNSGTEFPIFAFETRYVWRDLANGDLIVLQSKDLERSGATSFARVFVLSRYGRLIASMTMPTGRRLQIRAARFVSGTNGESTLVIETEPHVRGPDVRFQYYQYRDREFALFRVDDSHKQELPVEVLDGRKRPGGEPVREPARAPVTK